MKKSTEKRIGVTEFKAKCLALIDEVARGKTERLILTKGNAPVVIVSSAKQPMAPLWGALRGRVIIPPGADLTEPTGEVWEAERDSE